MVHHRDKAYPPLGKFAVQVFFHQLHIAGKAGLRFCQDDVKFPPLGCGQHPVECRAATVRAGIILVNVDGLHGIAMLGRIAQQHRALVLDALGLCAGFGFVLFA